MLLSMFLLTHNNYANLYLFKYNLYVIDLLIRLFIYHFFNNLIIVLIILLPVLCLVIYCIINIVVCSAFVNLRIHLRNYKYEMYLII